MENMRLITFLGKTGKTHTSSAHSTDKNLSNGNTWFQERMGNVVCLWESLWLVNTAGGGSCYNSVSAERGTRSRRCGPCRTWGCGVARPRRHLGAGVQGNWPRAAAAGRRGRHRTPMGDSRRNPVRWGTRRGRARQWAWLVRFPSEETGSAGSILTSLGSSRGPRSSRGVEWCIVRLGRSPAPVLQPPSPGAESSWFVYFMKVLPLQF